MNKKCLVKCKGEVRTLDVANEQVYLDGKQIENPIAIDCDLGVVRYITEFPRTEILSGAIEIKTKSDDGGKLDIPDTNTTDTVSTLDNSTDEDNINNKSDDLIEKPVKSKRKSMGPSRRGK